MLQVDWRDEAGNDKTLGDTNAAGSGEKLKLNDETGFFRFFGPEHHEMMVKVLDGCGLNDRFWVFVAAPTNVEFNLVVTDTEVPEVKAYFNPFGVEAPPITDTDAFATCQTATATAQTSASAADPMFAASARAGTCVADATTLCLHDDQFAVTVDWEDFASNTGNGTPVSLTDQSGYFWFFNADNPELLINIYDGRASNGNWWIFFSATTNVGFQLRVEDTLSGEIRRYENPLGATTTVLDTGPEPVPPQAIPALGGLGLLLLALGLAWLAGRERRRLT
jgi:hypothetical protein